MRRAGIGCGWRVVDPASSVLVMCGLRRVQRPTAQDIRYPCSSRSLGQVPQRRGGHERRGLCNGLFNPQLVKIALPANGSLPGVNAATLLPVGGEFVQTAGANLNGIVAKSGALVVAQSSTGKLFRIDPATGTAEEIDLGGVTLGSVDGLELQGRTLYAVRNTNQVSVVRLDSQFATGTVLGDITDPDLDVPTTATVAAGRLWAVNARFGTMPPPPDKEYWITQLPLRPENG